MIKIRIRCVICGTEPADELGMHGYPYSRCPECGHIFSRANGRGVSAAARKFELDRRTRRHEVFQNVILPAYTERIEPEKQRRLQMLKPLLREDESLLDANASDGWFVKQIGEMGHMIDGIAQEDTFSAYWGTTVFQSKLDEIDIGPTFDTILFIDYLEYTHCPYGEILDAYLRLQPAGRVLTIVPFGNDPKKNYLGRAHEFTEDSLRIFAKNASWEPVIQIIGNDALLELRRRATM